MKKLAAIFLVTILAFNWYGYRIVMTILAKNADKQLELKLDNDEYEETQLIELKVALKIPYLNSQADFERHYGEIEIDGQYYTYVKRKVDNGYLILKCIPNVSREKIEAAGKDYFEMTNGMGQPDNKFDKNNFAKNFWSEYDGRETDYNLQRPATFLSGHFINSSPFLYNIHLATPWQPPEPALLS